MTALTSCSQKSPFLTSTPGWQALCLAWWAVEALCRRQLVGCAAAHACPARCPADTLRRSGAAYLGVSPRHLPLHLPPYQPTVQISELKAINLSPASCCQGLRIMVWLAHMAMAFAQVTGYPMPPYVKCDLMGSALMDLGGMLSDRRKLAEATTVAQRRQEAAGLASALSAADLLRLCLMLHCRFARLAARETAAVLGRRTARMHELLQASLDDVQLLIALEGGGPVPPCYLRWRGSNHCDLEQHSQSVTGFEAALAACDASPGARPAGGLSLVLSGASFVQSLPCHPACAGLRFPRSRLQPAWWRQALQWAWQTS